MKIGVYVGSFNPVHIGHIHIVNYLINNNYLDKVIIIPTGNYWDKDNLIDIKHRINMLKFYENDRRIINDNEINTYDYTYQVMDKLKEEYINDDLYLIMGADNIINFHKWKNIDSILKNKVVVLNRDNINIEEYISEFNKDKFIIINDFKPINISSTKIRKNYKKYIKYLDKMVYNYIDEFNLYKGE